ncbi:peptidylprolyl isomerase [bacterium]|nr:peptidylprolyl isomerase [bacterium]
MRNSIFVFIIFTSIAIFAQSGVDLEERILSVVENEVITTTEVEMAFIIEGQTKNVDDIDSEELRAKVMEIIDERLILLAAVEDSLEVDQTRVEEYFKQRWQTLVEGYGGETALAEALEAEGFSVDSFKKKTRQQIKDFLLKQRYIEKNFGRVDVVQEDVDEFYTLFKDSLPTAPAEVEFDGIIIELIADSSRIKKAFTKIDDALDKIANGEDFSKIAVEVSEDATTAEKGGLLGNFARGDLLPALDSVAFTLDYEVIGGPVKTPMGYHLLKVLDKSAGKITLSHILFKVEVTPDRFNEIMALADSAISLAEAGRVDFSNVVTDLGSPPELSYINDVGWLPISALGKELGIEVKSAKEGDIIGPFEGEGSYEIYRIMGKREGRALTIEDDRELLEEYARQYKMKNLIDKHLQQLRKRYYIEMRI